MRPFTFVHAADLHVDSPFRGVGRISPSVAEVLRESTFRAFESLVDLCLERSIDFLVVAGDVYDGSDRSLRAQLRVRDGLGRLAEAGIPTFLVHGNHDPLDGRATAVRWPDEVHVFGARVESVVARARGEDLAQVTGVSFPRRVVKDNLARRFDPPATDLFRIGLLHANVGQDTGHEPYAPCELADLTGRGLDYWALGHVHGRRVLAEAPWVVYPGNPQGRSIRETGPRGAYVVAVDASGAARPEFVALDAVRWEEVRVSIDDLDGIDALEDSLAAGIGAARDATGGRPLVCRVRIDGRGPLHGALRDPIDREAVAERLRDAFADADPFAWIERMVVDTRPEADLEALARRDDLLGEILRTAGRLREDPAARDRLRTGALGELWSSARARDVLGGLDALDEDRLDALIAEAELLCLDELEGDE